MSTRRDFLTACDRFAPRLAQCCRKAATGGRGVTLLLALLVGCGSPEPAAPPPAGGGEAADVPPAQIRKYLEGLTSDNPRAQFYSLKALGDHPSVARTYREHIERVQKETTDEQVRRKATELLESLEPPPAE
jgi:hypothetical protein